RHTGDLPALAGAPGLRLRAVRAFHRTDRSDPAAGLATGDSRGILRPARADPDRSSATGRAGPQRPAAGVDPGWRELPVRATGRTPAAAQPVHLYLLFRLLCRRPGRAVLHPRRARHPAVRWALPDAALAGRL